MGGGVGGVGWGGVKGVKGKITPGRLILFDLLNDYTCIVFYAVSVIFRPYTCNGGDC